MFEEEEQIQVIRKNNRALRKVHKHLRRALKFSREYNDNLFLELCESDSLAQEALDRIRIEGNIDCDSDDYEYIIFECLKALQESRARL